MDDLATYRHRVGCFYAKASLKSSLVRSLPNENSRHSHRSSKQKFLRRPLIVIFVFLIVFYINKYGFFGSVTIVNTLPTINHSDSAFPSQQSTHTDITRDWYRKCYSVIPKAKCYSSIVLTSTKDIWNASNYNSKLEKQTNEVTGITCQYVIHGYNDVRNHIDMFCQHYEMTNHMQNISIDLLLVYPWQYNNDQTNSCNILRKCQSDSLESNYECSTYGTGTCYYLLGNKGMHMGNGNPGSKLSSAKAENISQYIEMVKDRAEESVGYITVGEGNGTGFRVCDTYLMTTFNVFSNKIDEFLDQIIFHLISSQDVPRNVLLSRIKDILEIYTTAGRDKNVGIKDESDEDFSSTARRTLGRFLDRTAYDTEKLVTRMKSIINTGPLLTSLFDDWKVNCYVDFINLGRFNVDWKIIYGNKDIDIIIVDLYPTRRNQNYPRRMILNERYRHHGGIQLIRYIPKYAPEITIEQRCKVFRTDNYLQRAVDDAIAWWVGTFPDEDPAFFKDEYKECCKAIDRETGRVILKPSESFIPGSPGSPIVYMLNNDGIPTVAMIYQGGLPPFYYEQRSRRFQSVDIDEKCSFGRATTMEKLANCLNEFQKTKLKQWLFSSEFIREPECIKREDAMTENVRAWEEVDAHFYETKVSKLILNKISDDKYPSVSVIGVPGSGKTAAIRHAALYLQNEKGFTIYPILEPKTFVEKFNMYLAEDTKKVFVFDDPVGSYSIDMNLLKLWDDHSEIIANCLSKNTKFLFSLRTQVNQHENVKFTSYMFNAKDRIIDMTLQQHSLGNDEMKSVLKCLLRTNQLPFPEDTLLSVVADRNNASSILFPLVCKMFCQQQIFRQNPEMYFRNLFPVIVQFFQKIKLHNKYQFCGLLLCAVFEDVSMESVFQGSRSETCIDQYRNDILTEMNLTKNDLRIVQRELRAIDDVYIKHIGKNVTFIHPLFKDIVLFLSNSSNFMLKYGSCQLIKDSIRVDVTLPNDHQFVVVLEGEQYISSLADRLVRDFWRRPLSGFSFIAGNYQIDNQRLFSCIKQKLLSKKPYNIPFFKTSFLNILKENNIYIHISVLYGSMKLTRYILSLIGNISDARLILHTACKAPSNNMKLVRLLIKHGADPFQLTETSESVLHSVICHRKYDSVELCKYFLQKGISVQTQNQDSESILHYIVKNELTKTNYLKLLIQHGSQLNVGNSYEPNSTINGKGIQVKLAKLFLRHGPPLDAVDKDGRSVLHYTALYETENQAQLAELFLNHGATIDTVDKDGRSVLHYTALYETENQAQLAELFLNNGASIDTVDKDGRSVLHYTALYETENQAQLAELFLNNGASIDTVDKDGRSVLHYTALFETENQPQLAELFLHHGVPIDAVDKDGRSVLHYTLCYKTENQVQLAELFLNHGASLNIVDNDRQSILHCVARYGIEEQVNLAELFIYHGAPMDVVDKDGQSVLHYTTRYKTENQVQLAELFLHQGSPLNVVDKDGQSVLHYTARYETENQVKVAELFLHHGASLDVVDKDRQTVLHYVARFETENQVKLAELFLHNGASLDVVDKDRQTVLHYVARFETENQVKLAELFLPRGASLDIVDKDRQTVLHYAARFETENQVQLTIIFLRHGAPLDVVDKDRQTVLHYVARYKTENQVQLADLFLRHGASLDVVDKDRQTVLHYVARFETEKQVQLAELFLQYGAPLDAVDKHGRSVLHYTARFETGNQVQLAELFLHQGGSLDVVDRDGECIPHYIVHYGREMKVKLAELLIKYGTHVSILDENGQTVLRYIARNEVTGKLQLVKLLINCEAHLKEVYAEKDSVFYQIARFKKYKYNYQKYIHTMKLFRMSKKNIDNLFYTDSLYSTCMEQKLTYN